MKYLCKASWSMSMMYAFYNEAKHDLAMQFEQNIDFLEFHLSRVTLAIMVVQTKPFDARFGISSL